MARKVILAPWTEAREPYRSAECVEIEVNRATKTADPIAPAMVRNEVSRAVAWAVMAGAAGPPGYQRHQQTGDGHTSDDIGEGDHPYRGLQAEKNHEDAAGQQTDPAGQKEGPHPYFVV